MYPCQPWSACVWNSCGSCAVTSTTSTWACSSAALHLLLPHRVHPSPRRSAIFTNMFFFFFNMQTIIFSKFLLLLLFWVSFFSVHLSLQSSGSCSFQEQQRILELFELSHEFKQQHYLAGLLLTELNAALDMESEGYGEIYASLL